jgi:hypothetical protein
MTNFVDRDLSSREIPKNGSFREFVEVKDGIIPSRESSVIYSTHKPLLEFKYKEIDTSRLNVQLSTSETCAGVPVYTNFEERETRKNFISDVISEIMHTCPTNTLLEQYGHYGEVEHTTHKRYKKQKSLERHARKIQRTFRKKFNLRKSKSAEKSAEKMKHKTRLMNYNNERVVSMLDKKYGMEYDDDDSVKLVMVITRNTEEGCASENYVLLSNSTEEVIESVGKLESLSRIIAKKFISLLERTTVKVNGNKIILLGFTLEKMLLFGTFITRVINGPESIVPIHLYDLSCNTFHDLQPPYTEMYKTEKDLNPKELSVVRIIDDYLRKKDIA